MINLLRVFGSYTLKKVLKVILALLIFLTGLSAWIVVTRDLKEREALASPDGKRVAFVMESLSEAGIAPYGEHVVVRPWWRIFGQYFVEPVFAGYCIGGANVAWGSSESLAIRCRAGKIVKQEAEANGVLIEYAITE